MSNVTRIHTLRRPRGAISIPLLFLWTTVQCECSPRTWLSGPSLAVIVRGKLERTSYEIVFGHGGWIAPPVVCILVSLVITVEQLGGSMMMIQGKVALDLLRPRSGFLVLVFLFLGRVWFSMLTWTWLDECRKRGEGGGGH